MSQTEATDARTDTATTTDDLEVTPHWRDDDVDITFDQTRHVFAKGDDSALCGHPTTHGDTRREFRADETPLGVVECQSCQTALLSESNDLNYQTDDEQWNTIHTASDGQQITVETEHGETLSGVVTSEERDPTGSPLVFVSFDTDPDNYNIATKDDDPVKFRISARPGDVSINRSVYEGDERAVTAITLGDTYEYRADENPDDIREVAERCEQEAAALHRDVETDDPDDRLAYLLAVNEVQMLSNASYLLRNDETETIKKVRQRAERRLGMDTDREDDETAAKVLGKRAGAEVIIDIIEDVVGSEDDSEGDGDDECETNRDCPDEHMLTVEYKGEQFTVCESCFLNDYVPDGAKAVTADSKSGRATTG